MGSASTGLQRQQGPLILDEYFELGLQEDASPFLTPSSRKWATNLTLKASFGAAALLVLAFILYFIPGYLPLAHLCMVGVYFLAGTPYLIDTVEDLASLQVNIDVLMTLAAFSSVLIGSGLEGGLLLVLFALSGAIEDAVTAKAKGSLSGLKKLAPNKAVVLLPDGTSIDRAVADLTVDSLILVKAGEVIPLDGIVVAGASSVNLIHLTGENFPVNKNVGDEVPAGARNFEGSLTVRVTRTSADSTLAKIIQLVTQAQEARPKLQRWFDRVSERYAITIILLSALFSIGLPLTHGLPFLGIEGSLYRSLAFLIAASPCALILAIPIAYLSAVSVCAHKGILIKGGITLDALASCHAIAFDKTGTLTTGNLTCLGVEGLTPSTPAEVDRAVGIAAALERNAVHPIARAIVNFAEQQRVTIPSLHDFISVPGYGLEGTVDLDSKPLRAYIGRLEYLQPHLSPQTATLVREKVLELREKGELLAIMVVEERIFLLRFRDTIRPEMRSTIQQLKSSKRWRLLMLTGDHMTNARKIAQELGLDEYYADLLPENKLEFVTRLANAHGLAMVGDGVNDAPALARATVGICMGKIGSSTAVDASDVVLLHDDLTLLEWLMDKARHTQVIVRQNLALAIIALITASSLALLGLIPLWLAVVMHEGGTVLVGINALRLLKTN